MTRSGLIRLFFKFLPLLYMEKPAAIFSSTSIILSKILIAKSSSPLKSIVGYEVWPWKLVSYRLALL